MLSAPETHAGDEWSPDLDLLKRGGRLAVGGEEGARKATQLPLWGPRLP